MFEKSRMKTALKNAEKTLAERDRIKGTIATGVVELAPMIRARLDAEAALSSAEVDSAIGVKGADVTAARRRAEDANAAIDKQAFKLRGLRERLVTQGAGLADAYAGIRTLLSDHNEDARENFRKEWDAVLGQFSRLLAKRQALERVLGPMGLPEPAAAVDAPDLGDLTAPHQTIGDLRAAVDDLSGWANMAAEPVAIHPNQPLRHYDPTIVYELAAPFEGIPAGATVIDATFPAGILRRLAMLGEAVPYERPEVQTGLHGARGTAAQMEEDSAADLRTRMDAEQAAHDAKLPKVPAPELSPEQRMMQELFENPRRDENEPVHVLMP